MNNFLSATGNILVAAARFVASLVLAAGRFIAKTVLDPLTALLERTAREITRTAEALWGKPDQDSDNTMIAVVIVVVVVLVFGCRACAV